MTQEEQKAVEEFTEMNLTKKGLYHYSDMQDAFLIGLFKGEKMQSSLPSNLDEAAEEALDDFDANWYIDELDDGCTEPGYNLKQMLLMFNAGVEWVAGQGVTKEAVIGMATEEISINVSEQTLNELDLCPGDKVVVQIRKK